MADLQRILGEAQAVHRQMQDAVQPHDAATAPNIVRLRTRFATLLAEMVGAVKSDAELQRRPGLAADFETRVGEMRRSLHDHQARWHSDEIDADPAGYRAATDALGSEQDHFYDWARGALADA